MRYNSDSMLEVSSVMHSASNAMSAASNAMKKLIASLTILAFFALPADISAEGKETVCTQSYGGGVVCGVHAPVETGIADSLPLIASGFLGAGGVIAYFSAKGKKQD